MTGTIERYAAPGTVDEAAEILRAGEVTILASGTDLMVQVEAGQRAIAATLMNILRIQEMRGIEEAGAAVRIGALTTITELMESDIVSRLYPALWEAGDHFASSQLRNAATLGGNIMNASPAGDTLIPLLIYNAEVELASKPNGALESRRVALGDFFTGPGHTGARPGELLTAIHLPLPPNGLRSRFYKFGTRPALDISTISIGLAGVPRDGALNDVRVAFGAVAPTPVRAPATEAAIEGRRLDDEAIGEIATVARGEARPIDDVRGSAWYRHELIHNITGRVLRDVAQA